jgi:predicted GIY-YIG superfamily endonuclease
MSLFESDTKQLNIKIKIFNDLNMIKSIEQELEEYNYNNYGCIYKIIIIEDNTCLYVGSTRNFHKRKKEHNKGIMRNIKGCEIVIIEECEDIKVEDLKKNEQEWIDCLNPTLNSRKAYGNNRHIIYSRIKILKYGCIYVITNVDNIILYVGSTRYFEERKNNHTNSTMKGVNYQWNMKIVKEFEEITDINLRKEEQKIIDNLKPLLNIRKAYTSYEQRLEYLKKYREEFKEKYKQYNKKYYEENKNKLKKQNKEYHEKNKDKIKEREKIYRNENKEKISIRKKKYYEKNKDKIKKYYEKNRDIILKRKEEKIECECGTIICKPNLNSHRKPQKHKLKMKNLKLELEQKITIIFED